MRINLRLDRQTSAHCYFTLYLNGGMNGQFATTHSEARDLRRILVSGLDTEKDTLELSGDWSGFP